MGKEESGEKAEVVVGLENTLRRVLIAFSLKIDLGDSGLGATERYSPDID